MRFPFKIVRVKDESPAIGPVEERASIENPTVPINASNIVEYFGGSSVRSGVEVNEETALTFSAVYACVRIKSEILASLPLNLYHREGENKSVAELHPIYHLLHSEPCEMYTSFDWRQLMEASVMLWGNGYSKIVRDKTFRPIWLDFIHPSIVEPFQIIRSDGTKALRYKIQNGSGEIVDAINMLHIKGISFDGIKGKSPIELAKESIGLGLANERFGAEFFANGSAFNGTINTEKSLTDNQKQALAKSWASRHSGEGNRFKTPVLDNGLKFEAIGIPPEQAQWIASRKFQLEEIARWFGIYLHQLADLDRATFSNIEQQGIEFVTHTIGPDCVRWEMEMNRKLLREDEKLSYYTKFNLEGLLRGDSAARAAFLNTMVGMGIFTRNEARKYEDKNPLDGLDEPLTPANLTGQQAKDLTNNV